mmetsp:Transcript_45451/g.119934  ORF Transcript_45451/g.119934 Transcript_45451/m.119934 type:complete len:254 (+) Transcript_45451:319-1080(+)
MWCGRSHALAKRRTPAPAARAACRRLQGHLNPCFGWDFAPASYVAVFMCAADVYLAWTYAVLEALRTRLRDTDNRIDRAERFSLVTTYLHGIASMMWLLLWLVGPPDGRWEVHLAIFSAALGFRYLCTLGNYVENRFGKAFEKGHVNTSHTLFIIVYGLVVAVLPVLYFVDITVYAAEGRTGIDPPLPWQLLQTFDILWMGCLSASTAMSVPEPPIIVTHKVLEFDDEFDPEDFTPAQQKLMRNLGYREVACG